MADSEGIVLAQSLALSKLSPLVREKGGGKTHLTRAQEQRQNEHIKMRTVA